MTKKYRISNSKKNTIEFNGRTLHRIVALKDFGVVRKGEFGGYVESEKNLSQDGKCWIFWNAKVLREARVIDSAQVCHFAVVDEYAEIRDKAVVSEQAVVRGYSQIADKANVFGKAVVDGHANVIDKAKVYGDARIYGGATIKDYARVRDNAHIYGNAFISGHSYIRNDARVFENAEIGDYAIIEGEAQIYAFAKVFDYASVKGKENICADREIYGEQVIGEDGEDGVSTRLRKLIHDEQKRPFCREDNFNFLKHEFFDKKGKTIVKI